MQVVPGIDKKKASADTASLVEVGPRVCLNPIKIFGGSFGGPVLFDNPHFVSPNRVSTKVLVAECSGQCALSHKCSCCCCFAYSCHVIIHRPCKNSVSVQMQGSWAMCTVAQIRALLKKREASKYGSKVSAKAQRRQHQQAHQLPHDDLADVFK